jgi:mono/diheme cytochrome c family protein
MSHRRLRIGQLLVLLGFVAGTPVVAADIKQGETLAKRWCATCHLAAAGQTSATTDAPPFASVAAKPGFNAGKLAFFLLDPHPKMPAMSLSRKESEDLAAYIASLK